MNKNIILLVLIALVIQITSAEEVPQGVSDCVDDENNKGNKNKNCYIQFISEGVETSKCEAFYEDEYQDIKQTIEMIEDAKGRFSGYMGGNVKIVEVIDCSSKYLTAISLAFLLFLL